MKKAPETKPSSKKTLRVLCIALLMALSFSGFQYYQTGRLNWHITVANSVRELTTGFVKDSAEITADNAQGIEISGLVSKVTDGDTFELRSALLESNTIRLHGIDTPEWDQDHGAMASAALKEKLAFKQVSVVLQDIDSYGRYVGIVYLDERNINLEMVAEGHAWWYEYYASDNRELQQAQALARKNNLGLWASSKPMPPWDWRRSR